MCTSWLLSLVSVWCTRCRQFLSMITVETWPVLRLCSANRKTWRRTWWLCTSRYRYCHRSVYIYPDTVPPVHVISYHVATDKPPSQDGDKFQSIFSDNLQPIATRGKKAPGTLLVDQHCGNSCLIKRAPLSHWGGSRHSQANVSQAAWIHRALFMHLWVCKRCLLVVVVVVACSAAHSSTAVFTRLHSSLPFRMPRCLFT